MSKWKIVNLRIPKPWIPLIDQLKGDMARTRWIRQLVRDELKEKGLLGISDKQTYEAPEIPYRYLLDCGNIIEEPIELAKGSIVNCNIHRQKCSVVRLLPPKKQQDLI